VVNTTKHAGFTDSLVAKTSNEQLPPQLTPLKRERERERERESVHTDKKKEMI